MFRSSLYFIGCRKSSAQIILCKGSDFMASSKTRFTAQALCLTCILAVLSYVCFTFIQFKIPLPGGDATSIHLGNMVPVLGALLFGGIYGGLGGAIGMTLGDLLDPVYIVYAPKTFILKFCIGFIAGLVADKVFHLKDQRNRQKMMTGAIVSAAAGLAFNAIFDPLLGYVYKLVILGRSVADITLTWDVAACVINAVISTAVSVALYMALRPALEKSGLLAQFGKN